jgi:hypothetical protein
MKSCQFIGSLAGARSLCFLVAYYWRTSYSVLLKTADEISLKLKADRVIILLDAL